jgi:hypothetical protein
MIYRYPKSKYRSMDHIILGILSIDMGLILESFYKVYKNRIKSISPERSKEYIEIMSKDISIVMKSVPDEKYDHLIIEFFYNPDIDDDSILLSDDMDGEIKIFING